MRAQSRLLKMQYLFNKALADRVASRITEEQFKKISDDFERTIRKGGVMDLEKAIQEGTRMKFEPPILDGYIGRLKAIEELFPIPRAKVEISVHAVNGLYNILMDIAQGLETIAEKMAREIDEAPETELPGVIPGG
jgi:hypothetical protein